MPHPIKSQLHDVISGKSRVRFGETIQAVIRDLEASAGTGAATQAGKHLKNQEAARLIAIAKERKCWVDDIDFERYISEGAEQRVYLNGDTSVLKLNDAIYYASTTLVKKTITAVKYLREKTLAPHTFSFKFFNSMKTASQILVYSTNNATAEIDVRVDGGTVWLNRHQLAELFERDVKTIGKHIANALNEELSGFPVVAKFATTASDGKTYSVEHFNLDVVLSVGYRVKSQAGVQFRVWATRVLNEHLIRGYSTSQRFDSIHHELGELEARVNRIEIRIQADLPPTQGVFLMGKFTTLTRL